MCGPRRKRPIATRLEAIASRLEAIALLFPKDLTDLQEFPASWASTLITRDGLQQAGQSSHHLIMPCAFAPTDRLGDIHVYMPHPSINDPPKTMDIPPLVEETQRPCHPLTPPH